MSSLCVTPWNFIDVSIYICSTSHYIYYCCLERGGRSVFVGCVYLSVCLWWVWSVVCMFCVYIVWIINAPGNRKRSCTLTFDWRCCFQLSPSPTLPLHLAMLIAFQFIVFVRLLCVFLSLICRVGREEFYYCRMNFELQAAQRTAPPSASGHIWL